MLALAWAEFKTNCCNCLCPFETGPYVKKLCALSEILKGSSVPVNPSMLTRFSPETFQNECRSILEQLQEKGLFSLARKVAELAELPADSVVTREVRHREQWWSPGASVIGSIGNIALCFCVNFAGSKRSATSKRRGRVGSRADKNEILEKM